MRESFGGLFMIRLLLVFIVIYVAFTAISLNYAKAFRVKNKVISFVEENEILNLSSLDSGNGVRLSKLDKILKDANYNVKCANGNGKIATSEDLENSKDIKKYCYNGIIIERVTTAAEEKKNGVIRYEVTTYVNWSLEFMNRLLMLAGRTPNANDIIGGTWAISGEAKVVKQ